MKLRHVQASYVFPTNICSSPTPRKNNLTRELHARAKKHFPPPRGALVSVFSICLHFPYQYQLELSDFHEILAVDRWGIFDCAIWPLLSTRVDVGRNSAESSFSRSTAKMQNIQSLISLKEIFPWKEKKLRNAECVGEAHAITATKLHFPNVKWRQFGAFPIGRKSPSRWEYSQIPLQKKTKALFIGAGEILIEMAQQKRVGLMVFHSRELCLFQFTTGTMCKRFSLSIKKVHFSCFMNRITN